MAKAQRNKGLGFPATAAERAAWLHSMTPCDGSPHPYGDDWADPVVAEILADALWGDDEPEPRHERKGRQCVNAEGHIRCVRCGGYREPDQFAPRRSVCAGCLQRLDEVQSKKAQNRVREAIKARRVDRLLKEFLPRVAADQRTMAGWAVSEGCYTARQERRLAEFGAREWLVRWLLDPENGSPLSKREA